jgi:hypothetical protein
MSTVRRVLVRMIDDSLSDDPKRALVAAVALQGEVEWLLQRTVALARAEGYDWGRIGRLLGVSRQAARQRFRTIVPKAPPHTANLSFLERQMRDGERRVNEIRDRNRNGGYDDDPVAW